MQSDFDLLNYIESMDCQEIHVFVDKPTNLKAIIAIHSLELGPALGGSRFMAYDSTEMAIKDAIRLAQGMTHKAAAAGLHLGGGKAVLIKPKVIQDKSAYFQAFGRFVESLNGRYITAGDLGMSVEEMDIIATQTRHVMGTSKGRFKEHDPSVATAWGVFQGIKAAVQFKLKRDSLEGIHVVVQGLGHVGDRLISHLHQAGATLSVFDINSDLVEKAQTQYQAKALLGSDVFKTPCDVFAPCALGGILNPQTIAQLQTTIVAGGANTQLETDSDAQLLHERGILYAPDYVINAGGVIYVAEQYNGLSEAQVHKRVENIYARLIDIFERSKYSGLNPLQISEQMIHERLTKEHRS